MEASDSYKLRLLADWFDVKDRETGNTSTEVQDWLRNLAELLETEK